MPWRFASVYRGMPMRSLNRKGADQVGFHRDCNTDRTLTWEADGLHVSLAAFPVALEDSAPLNKLREGVEGHEQKAGKVKDVTREHAHPGPSCALSTAGTRPLAGYSL